MRSLKGKYLPWYEDPRSPDLVWMKDSIKRMKETGGVKGDTLIEIGIKKVTDIKQKSENELLTLSKSILGVSLLWLCGLRNTRVTK